MGDITDMILDGILCEVCGCVVDFDSDDLASEYPRTCCESCKEEQDKRNKEFGDG